MLLERNNITQSIEPYVDRPVIKVLNGLRRSGKSSILALLKNLLLGLGRSFDQILSFNFESMQYSDIHSSQDLYRLISTNINPNKKSYLFIDEVQEVTEWEKCINSCLVDFDKYHSDFGLCV